MGTLTKTFKKVNLAFDWVMAMSQASKDWLCKVETVWWSVGWTAQFQTQRLWTPSKHPRRLLRPRLGKPWRVLEFRAPARFLELQPPGSPAGLWRPGGPWRPLEALGGPCKTPKPVLPPFKSEKTIFSRWELRA